MSTIDAEKKTINIVGEDYFTNRHVCCKHNIDSQNDVNGLTCSQRQLFSKDDTMMTYHKILLAALGFINLL